VRKRRQSQAKAERHSKTMQALQLRASGATYKQIAAALGVSEPTAWRLVQRESESIIRESAAQVLELELTRLDRLQMAVWPEAINGDAQAIDRVLKIMDMRAKLLGLYDHESQPEQFQPEGVVIISAESSQEEYIAGLRALRGELPPPTTNGNGDAGS
jgi:DNA-binding Lrp family transcriptional regulator